MDDPFADGVAVYRSGLCYASRARGVRTAVSQSTRAWRICRAWRDAVLKRRQRTRTRDRQRRQPTGARGDGRTCVDVVALAAGQRLVRVVPRACRRNGRADQEDHDRRPGSQAARRLVALREGWRHSRRSKDEIGVRTAFLSHAKQGRWSAVAAKNRGPVRAPMCRLDPPQRAPLPDVGIVVRDRMIPPDTRLAGSVPCLLRPELAETKHLALDLRALIRGLSPFPQEPGGRRLRHRPRKDRGGPKIRRRVRAADQCASLGPRGDARLQTTLDRGTNFSNDKKSARDPADLSQARRDDPRPRRL